MALNIARSTIPKKHLQARGQRPLRFLALASAYRRSEDIGIEAIVIAELELGNIERHVFGAHLVESADNAAFEDRSKTFDGVGVDRTNNVLLAVVIDGWQGTF